MVSAVTTFSSERMTLVAIYIEYDEVKKKLKYDISL